MMDNNKSASTGIGFSSLLQVAFIVLKLCKVINWSWWWVLAPLWIDGIVLLIAILGLIIVRLLEKKIERERHKEWWK